jgi:hypothetical protein
MGFSFWLPRERQLEVGGMGPWHSNRVTEISTDANQSARPHKGCFLLRVLCRNPVPNIMLSQDYTCFYYSY